MDRFLSFFLLVAMLCACKPLRTAPQSRVLDTSLPAGYDAEQMLPSDIQDAYEMARERDRFWPIEEYQQALTVPRGEGLPESIGVKITYKRKMVGYMLFYVGDNHIGVQDVVIAKSASAPEVSTTLRAYMEARFKPIAEQLGKPSSVALTKFDANRIDRQTRFTELGFSNGKDNSSRTQEGEINGEKIMLRELEGIEANENLKLAIEEFENIEQNKLLSQGKAKYVVSPKMRRIFNENFESLNEKFSNSKPLKVNDQALARKTLESFQSFKTASLVVTGDTGSGKTVAVESIADDIVKGKYQEVIPKDSVIVTTEASKLIGGTKYVGSGEEKIEALKKMVELERARGRKVVLIVDEIDTLAKFGGNTGSLDFFSSIRSLLSKGELVLIGTTLPERWRALMAEQTDLGRRFLIHNMPTLSETQIVERFRDWVTQNNLKERFWEKGGPIPSATEREILNLVKRFQPNKGILNAMVDIADKMQAGNYVAEKAFGERVVYDITPEIARNKVSSILQIDKADLGDRGSINDKMQTVEKKLNSIIKGREAQMKEILMKFEESFYPRDASVKGPSLKLHFDGIPGTAKTLIFEIIAEGLDLQVTKIKMADYNVGGKSVEDFRGEVAKAVEGKSRPLILFDELEKARVEIIQSIYDLYAEGEVTGTLRKANGESEVRKIDCRNARIGSTGNITEEAFYDKMVANKGDLTLKEARQILGEHFGRLEGKSFSDAFPRRIGSRNLFVFGASDFATFTSMFNHSFDRFINGIAESGGHRLDVSPPEKQKIFDAFAKEFYGPDPQKPWQRGVTPAEMVEALHETIRRAAFRQGGDSTFRIPSALSFVCDAA